MPSLASVLTGAGAAAVPPLGAQQQQPQHPFMPGDAGFGGMGPGGMGPGGMGPGFGPDAPFPPSTMGMGMGMGPGPFGPHGGPPLGFLPGMPPPPQQFGDAAMAAANGAGGPMGQGPPHEALPPGLQQLLQQQLQHLQHQQQQQPAQPPPPMTASALDFIKNQWNPPPPSLKPKDPRHGQGRGGRGQVRDAACGVVLWRG